MAEKLHEILVRYDENENVSGAHVRYANWIDGKAYISPPKSIAGLKADETLAAEVEKSSAASAALAKLACEDAESKLKQAQENHAQEIAEAQDIHAQELEAAKQAGRNEVIAEWEASLNG